MYKCSSDFCSDSGPDGTPTIQGLRFPPLELLVPIPLTCPCGRSLNIKDELAGRKVRCPACRDVLSVPDYEEEPEPEPEVIEAIAADPAEDDDDFRVTARPGSRSSRPVRRREPELDTPPPRKRRRRRLRHDDDRGPRVAFERGWFGSVNAGVAGGLLMIVIAIVWFVVGLAGGIIFFYPPVLLVIGIVAMIKGMMGGE